MRNAMPANHAKQPPHDDIHINANTREETIHLATPEFPYMTDLCDLHHLPGCTFPWHWHREVELFYMREGELDYVLPTGTFTFKKGEGGFLNANVLHMTCCREHLPCLQEEHLFLPQFIGGQEHSVFMRRYIQPILDGSGLELYRFDPEIPEHQEIIRLMASAHALYCDKPEEYEFDIREAMTAIWRLLYRLTRDIAGKRRVSPHGERIKTMLEYIAAHYSQRLTLQDIAASGFISVRECCRCFQESLGQTPISYLTDVRLHNACGLLENTTASITEICTACGFNSSSYFGRVFKGAFGCTPREYRDRLRRNGHHSPSSTSRTLSINSSSRARSSP